jgi:hypothetical protein
MKIQLLLARVLFYTVSTIFVDDSIASWAVPKDQTEGLYNDCIASVWHTFGILANITRA